MTGGAGKAVPAAGLSADVCLFIAALPYPAFLYTRDGIVAARRQGQVIWYRVESEPARRVMAVLYESFCA